LIFIMKFENSYFMKPTLLFATLPMIFASLPAFAKSELETLRSLCTEQERQIRQLEIENSQLRSGKHEAPAPAAKTETPPPAASQPAAVASPPVTPTTSPTYKIKQGETFSSIAKKHKIRTEALIAANPKVNPLTLHPGQIINLSGTAPAAKATTVSKKTPPSTPPLEASPPPASKSASAPTKPLEAEKEQLPSNPDKKYRTITVEGEITYGEFASKYGTDAERLNSLNGLDLPTTTILAKGSELYVPAQP
jgi:LysM repeat protein